MKMFEQMLTVQREKGKRCDAQVVFPACEWLTSNSVYSWRVSLRRSVPIAGIVLVIGFLAVLGYKIYWGGEAHGEEVIQARLQPTIDA